jgi:hypothetical protein
MIQRLADRSENPFRKTQGDLGRVLSDTENIEPPLRRAADHEISTTVPLGDVVRATLRVVGE